MGTFKNAPDSLFARMAARRTVRRAFRHRSLNSAQGYLDTVFTHSTVSRAFRHRSLNNAQEYFGIVFTHSTVGRNFTLPRDAAALELLEDAPLSEKNVFRSFGTEPDDPNLEAFRRFSTFSLPQKKNFLGRLFTAALPVARTDGARADIEPQEPSNDDWFWGILITIIFAIILFVANSLGHAGW